jgi:hypothetical protein
MCRQAVRKGQTGKGTKSGSMQGQVGKSRKANRQEQTGKDNQGARQGKAGITEQGGKGLQAGRQWQAFSQAGK